MLLTLDEMGCLLNYIFQSFLVMRMIEGHIVAANGINQVSGRNLKVAIAQVSLNDKSNFSKYLIKT